MSDQPFGAGKEDGEQGSVAWLYERVGKVTASRFKDVIAVKKNGEPTAEREKYLWEIVIERLTGKPKEHYTNDAMQYGTEQEVFARIDYEAKTGAFVTETGFIESGEVEMCGGSPDGLVDDDGGIEIKCPWNSAIHLATWINGMPPEHMAQVQGLMWITGREWWDFVSYDARMPAEYQLYVQRIKRDEDYLMKLYHAVMSFQKDADALIATLREAAK